jgi:hypothetical protein
MRRSSHHFLQLAINTLVSVQGANHLGATCQALGLYVTVQP